MVIHRDHPARTFFRRYIAVSPSLQWMSSERLIRPQQFFGEKQSSRKRVFSLGKEGKHTNPMGEGFRAASEVRLKAKDPNGFSWEFGAHPGRTHGHGDARHL